MQGYALSILAASLVGIVISLLSPEGATAKYLRLTVSLVLLCALLSPLPSVLGDLLADGGLSYLPEDASPEDYEEEFDEALSSASKDYFSRLLSKSICEELSLPEGTVRCAILWADGDELSPVRVTVILSGSSIWKDPAPIKAFVKDLLSCECTVAIER